MVHQRLDDPAGALQPQARPDVDRAGARGHEAVDQVLRERPVDLGGLVGTPREAVACFLRTDVEWLVMENLLARRRSMPTGITG